MTLPSEETRQNRFGLAEWMAFIVAGLFLFAVLEFAFRSEDARCVEIEKTYKGAK